MLIITEGLIALVVTIVVLLILAGITISLVFDENGVVTKAREAAEKTNQAIANEQSSLRALDDYMSNMINGLGGAEDTTKDWDLSIVDKVTSADGVVVPVPKGYTASSIPTENTVKDGFVIYENINGEDEEVVNESNKDIAQTTRNQFVWVPVKDIEEYKLISWNGEKVADNVTDDNANDTYYEYREYNLSQQTNLEELAGDDAGGVIGREDDSNSIKLYGGFYMGRYEASYNTNTNKIETQKDKIPYTNVSYQSAINPIISSSRMSIQHNYLIPMNSVMATGKHWDAMIKWINETNSNIKGNTGTSIIKTGSKEEYKANNIYDIAGNVAEWSYEYYGINNENVIRGGAYNQENVKANQREHNSGEASEQIGFRTSIVLPLQVMEGEEVLQ